MEGTIVKILSNLFTVEISNKFYDCHARGKFRKDKLTPRVGDKVIVDLENKYILDIKERKNVFDRPMIANIDSAIIVTSVKKPDLSLNLLDKQLCLIISKNVEPIIVLTKMDLLKNYELKEVKKLIKYYKSIGINVVTNKQTFKLTKLIKNKMVVLTGQTGAGKSTLLNKLDKKLNLATGAISEALGRGKHTTRHVELFKYKSSLIADTPGFSALDIEDLSNDEIKNSFLEFKLNCKFKDCNHIKEAGCQVIRNVNNNKILLSRYENYLKFRRK